MKRSGIGLVLCMAALVGCGPREVTLHFVEHADTDEVTDMAPPGDSAGDLLTFANPLYDRTNSTQLGTNQGYCVRAIVGQSW